MRATEELLATHGLEHVSMDRVAQAAGVGKGTVFHHFGNREGLMRAVVEERVRALHLLRTGESHRLAAGLRSMIETLLR
ncbi:TetR/AcrR family transcriptional regulator [Amycolatopsis sp. NBC_00438]|uniref:TetR/AcrR family transcriptional regulator n=1 Tax=Amycolatopsis sp. NBC_00438 TaxID=2903558 RepID=UPI002E201360